MTVPARRVRAAVATGLRVCLRPRPPLARWVRRAGRLSIPFIAGLHAMTAQPKPSVLSWEAATVLSEFRPRRDCGEVLGETPGVVVDAYRSACHEEMATVGATWEEQAEALGYGDRKGPWRAAGRWRRG